MKRQAVKEELQIVINIAYTKYLGELSNFAALRKENVSCGHIHQVVAELYNIKTEFSK